jgi:hypothetical protein
MVDSCPSELVMTVGVVGPVPVPLVNKIVDTWPSELVTRVEAAVSVCELAGGNMVDTWPSELVMVVGVSEPSGVPVLYEAVVVF